MYWKIIKKLRKRKRTEKSENVYISIYYFALLTSVELLRNSSPATVATRKQNGKRGKQKKQSKLIELF